jgi:serine protein kinase
MMKEVEKTLEIAGKPEEFRQSLIAKIGAWSLDHRGQKPVIAEIFAEHLRRLRDAYFEKHKKTIGKNVSDLMKYLAGYESNLAAADKERAEAGLKTLVEKHGYTKESARDLVGALASLRYRS